MQMSDPEDCTGMPHEFIVSMRFSSETRACSEVIVMGAVSAHEEFAGRLHSEPVCLPANLAGLSRQPDNTCTSCHRHSCPCCTTCRWGTSL
jgi:hypothetical protein